ncbi:DUF397 domain-containing protein [Micromonospora sp. KC213]|nr:DUF397 domain-containing protein [Micromonospora sp. KC213]
MADNLPEIVGVHDSRNRAGPALTFKHEAWTSFVTAVKQSS